MLGVESGVFIKEPLVEESQGDAAYKIRQDNQKDDEVVTKGCRSHI